MTDRIDPDCVAGKHRACRGEAWGEVNDRPAPCECPCHDAHVYRACDEPAEYTPPLEVVRNHYAASRAREDIGVHRVDAWGEFDRFIENERQGGHD